MVEEQRCRIVGTDPKYSGVVCVKVPDIYKATHYLPDYMAKLVRPAAESLDKAIIEITQAGGTLFISDMFRSTEAQRRAYLDWKTGRKSAYSPPPGGSMHEAARAIDIDVGNTIIGLARTKAILKKHGWIGIAARGSECWHHDWRGDDGQAAYSKGGYKAMARFCINAINNKTGEAENLAEEAKVKWIQTALNKIQNAGLMVDGDYGSLTKAAVVQFQGGHGLVPDGIVGPITERVLKIADGGY